MRKIRVLVVDDSTVIRRLLTDSLASDPDLEVAGTAANGKIALAKITQVNPDVITLDMEMPEMDGIATLVEVRKLYPKLPVIMFSTLTQRGAEATLDALAKGANDYVTKPANVGSVTAAMQNVRNELVPKIKAFCPWFAKCPVTPLRPRPSIKPNLTVQSRSSEVSRIDIVAIGSSTGGPNALQAVLAKIPENFPVPIVVVQHMPPIFTKHLADRLRQLTSLNVVEAKRGDVLAPGGVWIAPGDFHMTLGRQGTTVRIDLNQGTPENSCRPAVDVLFRSVTDLYGPNVLSVVLTGMGQDGARGCEVIRSAGGRVFAQDEETSVVWGMPGAVAQAGLADRILPLDKIADEIVRETIMGRKPRTLEKVGT
jgi:two-component system, chemotaxis family, protein-glutamate methylesterase/glutaminase